MRSEPRPVVGIIDSVDNSYVEQPDIEQAVMAEEADVRLLRVADWRDLLGQVAGLDAILSWHTVPLPAPLVLELDRCRAIVRAAVGFDNIDLAAAARLGIPVLNVPDYGVEEVADHTLALLLATLRRLPALDRHVRGGGWDWRVALGTRRIRGTTLGIVGLGRIGAAVARRAVPFGFQLLFCDPYISDGADKVHGAERVESLAELLRRSDVVTLHVPLTDETAGLIGRAELDAIGPAGVLVNTARGPVIDAGALADALAERRLFAAALDVIAGEPALPAALRASPHALLTPHSAFYSEAALTELRTKAARAALGALRGALGRSVVNGIRRPRDPVLSRPGAREAHSQATR